MSNHDALGTHEFRATPHQRLSLDLGRLSMLMALQRMAAHCHRTGPDSCTLYGIAVTTTSGCTTAEYTVANLDVFPTDTDIGDRSPILAAAAALRACLPGIRAFGLARMTSVTDREPGQQLHADIRYMQCVATLYDATNLAYVTAVHPLDPAAARAEIRDIGGSRAVRSDLLRRLRHGESAAQTWAAALTLAPVRNATIITEMRAATT